MLYMHACMHTIAGCYAGVRGEVKLVANCTVHVICMTCFDVYLTGSPWVHVSGRTLFCENHSVKCIGFHSDLAASARADG